MSGDWKQPCWNVTAEPGGLRACVVTCCFPCITYGINITKLGDAKEVMCSGQFTPACCLYCCATSVGCPCIVHIPARKNIREKYNIQEPQHGLLEDVLMTWCCSCCAIIQDYNEISAARGEKSGTIFSDLLEAFGAADTGATGKADEVDKANKENAEVKDAETKSADETAEKNADEEAEKSADEKAEKSADEKAEKSADEKAEKSADEKAEKSADEKAEEADLSGNGEHKSS
ncbi:hypothetical protein VOLCADRAFT_103592 [Volvox carteri f. nagariensis]|uniref:Uncharacterized protein n=1 Tax=Volvox carteri f. nagariensis TaxID=3068 RepID=D8TN09_VOLCA|nr:uncharacterized protein VOLCADRAFT_103592 [Volvox carteri f. nagariensis]EFJ51220.1 hypothetical protein VOLCADRAFT_103592 [Volvox carteri f. nagariensis]|eukprot:XP_002947687.1 hypothetical protein VOLCADRAFT_103592 [Volvox carteri f. nagariensis]